MNRAHYRMAVDGMGAPTFLPSGEYMQANNRLFQPAPDEIRRMLGGIREELNLSVAMLGALLGAPRVTVRKWLSGERSPTGASRRLIWLLHTRLFAPEVLDEPGAWLLWTRRPDRGASQPGETLKA